MIPRKSDRILYWLHVHVFCVGTVMLRFSLSKTETEKRDTSQHRPLAFFACVPHPPSPVLRFRPARPPFSFSLHHHHPHRQPTSSFKFATSASLDLHRPHPTSNPSIPLHFEHPTLNQTISTAHARLTTSSCSAHPHFILSLPDTRSSASRHRSFLTPSSDPHTRAPGAADVVICLPLQVYHHRRYRRREELPSIVSFPPLLCISHRPTLSS